MGTFRSECASVLRTCPDRICVLQSLWDIRKSDFAGQPTHLEVEFDPLNTQLGDNL